MNRRVPLFRRFAVVSHSADGTVTLHSAHLTHGGAVVAAVAGWTGGPVRSVAPTDWAPLRERRAAVLRVMAGRGEFTAADVSRLTALSPRCVELELLAMWEQGWLRCRSLGPGLTAYPAAGYPGDARAWRLRLYRLRSPEELTALARQQYPPRSVDYLPGSG